MVMQNNISNILFVYSQMFKHSIILLLFVLLISNVAKSNNLKIISSFIISHEILESDDSSKYIILKGKVTRFARGPQNHVLIYTSNPYIQTNSDIKGEYILMLLKEKYIDKTFDIAFQKSDLYDVKIHIKLKSNKVLNVCMFKDLDFHPFYQSKHSRHSRYRFPSK